MKIKESPFIHVLYASLLLVTISYTSFKLYQDVQKHRLQRQNKEI
ncbi:MAG: hypothetical protein AAF849_00500 [Bacteroidota bacterium]